MMEDSLKANEETVYRKKRKKVKGVYIIDTDYTYNTHSINVTL